MQIRVVDPSADPPPPARRSPWPSCLLAVLVFFFIAVSARLALQLNEVCLPFLPWEQRTRRTFRVDVTPLAALSLPAGLALPEADRTISLLTSGDSLAEPWFLVGEVSVHLWRYPAEAAEPAVIGCDGAMIEERKDGVARLYCVAVAQEQVDESGCGAGVFDSSVTLRKGNVYVNLLNTADPTPDGSSESTALRTVVGIWERRIEAGNAGEFYPGEYVFEQWCSRCHAAGQAPGLQGLYLSPVLLDTGAQLTADESYLRQSIQQPAAHTVQGYPPGSMPALQQMPNAWRLEQSLGELIVYLENLR